MLHVRRSSKCNNKFTDPNLTKTSAMLIRYFDERKEKLNVRHKTVSRPLNVDTWHTLPGAYQVAFEKGYACSFRNRICCRYVMQ